MPAIVALLDANVLIPAAPRDTLLRAAERGLYTPRWSDAILREVEHNLVVRGMTSHSEARGLAPQIHRFFPEAHVSGHEPLIDAMTNDLKDRHVLAAAVHTGADTVVTENLNDFPRDSLEPHGIEALSIDTFLVVLMRLSSTTMVQIIREQAADLDDPPLTVGDVLAEIARVAPGFAEHMRRTIEDS